MKKFLSLLLTAVLLCCTLIPSLAEEAAAPLYVTLEDYQTAFTALALENAGIEVTWQEVTAEDGTVITMGSIAGNPCLTAQNGYVNMIMITVPLDENAEASALVNTFMLLSSYACAAPLIANGEDTTAALERVAQDFATLFTQFSAENPALVGPMGDLTVLIMPTQEGDVVYLTLTVPMEVPAAE